MCTHNIHIYVYYVYTYICLYALRFVKACIFTCLEICQGMYIHAYLTRTKHTLTQRACTCMHTPTQRASTRIHIHTTCMRAHDTNVHARARTHLPNMHARAHIPTQHVCVCMLTRAIHTFNQRACARIYTPTQCACDVRTHPRNAHARTCT